MSFDAVERRMLRALQANGRISNTKLAEQVGISETPCLRRLRLLEDSGVITGYRAVLSREKLGLKVTAFVLVDTNQRTETDRMLFMEAVRKEPRIIECAAVSGGADFILKVVADDIEGLAELTMGKLLSLPTVDDVSSSIVFKWLKENEPFPV